MLVFTAGILYAVWSLGSFVIFCEDNFIHTKGLIIVTVTTDLNIFAITGQ